MADAGEVKAKVTIEYDGSGVDKAKEDLASLAEAARSAGDGASSASEGMAQLEERAGKASDGVAQLAEHASSLEEPLKAGQVAISEVTDTLGEHQAAIENTGKAYEALAGPLGTTVSMLENASPPMMAISEHAQTMAAQLAPIGDGFTQIGDSLSQTIPMLPEFAASARVVDSTLAGNSQGFSDFHENMAVFQDALENPSPFSMINQHLSETGQTWDDFTSSIGDNNVAMLHDMASNADVTHQVMGGMASNAQSMGQTFQESADSTKAFTEQFNSLGAAATDVNKTIGETGTAIEDVGKAATGGGFGGFLSEAAGGVGGFFGGIMNSMNAIAMPLMAVQMIGMAVQTVSAGIYNAAAIAEGPGAHSINSFTGQIDLLTQNSQKAGQAFSEAFGQNLLPSIKAINEVTGTSDFWGGVGGVLGGALTLGVTAAELGIGGALAVTGQFNNPLLQMGIASIQNEFGAGPAGATPQTPAQVYLTQQTAQIGNTVSMNTAQSQAQSAVILAEAATPSYLQSQDYSSASAQYLARQQASYNASHPITQTQLAQDASYNAYMASQEIAYQNSPTYAQIAGQDFSRGNGAGGIEALGAAFGLNNMQNLGSGPQSILGALFGQSGGGVNFGNLFGGIGNFFNGSGSGTIGDMFNQMLGGGDAHAATFGQAGGASGAFGLGSSQPDSSGAVSKTIPITVSWDISGELQKTWQASSAWNIAGDLAKSWQASSVWSLAGDLAKAWQASSAWNLVGQLEKDWQSVSMWSLAGDLQKTWQSVSSWNIVGDLEKDWQAVSLWSLAGDLNKMWQSTSTWNLSGDLNKAWQSAVTWKADNLDPIFNASPIWNASNLNPVFQVAASFLGVPGFASGVENFSGGAAIVGEKGPELVTLPSGSSVYPMTVGAGVGSSVSMGGGSGGSPQSVNLTVQIDSQSLIQAMGIPLSQNMRVSNGMRGY